MGIEDGDKGYRTGTGMVVEWWNRDSGTGGFGFRLEGRY